MEHSRNPHLPTNQSLDFIFIRSLRPLFNLVLAYFPSLRFAIAFNTSLLKLTVYQDPFFICSPLFVTLPFSLSCSAMRTPFYFVLPSLFPSLSSGLFLCLCLSILPPRSNAFCSMCIPLYISFPEFPNSNHIAHLHYFVVETFFR